jgi:hypothetical protein
VLEAAKERLLEWELVTLSAEQAQAYRTASFLLKEFGNCPEHFTELVRSVSYWVKQIEDGIK